MSDFTTINDVIKADVPPIIKRISSSFEKENPKFTNFNTLSPNITGIANIKVNSLATFRFIPMINAPRIVAPLLDVPGNIARH